MSINECLFSLVAGEIFIRISVREKIFLKRMNFFYILPPHPDNGKIAGEFLSGMPYRLLAICQQGERGQIRISIKEDPGYS